jgi:hypothetical protein
MGAFAGYVSDVLTAVAEAITAAAVAARYPPMPVSSSTR